MPWRPSVAGVAAAVGAAALLAIGVVAGRVDVAILGVPLAAGVAWGWATRPRGSIRVDRSALIRGPEPGRLATELPLITPEGADAVLLRLQAPGFRVTETLLAPDHRTITASVVTVRTGRLELFPLDALGIGVDGVTRSSPIEQPALRATLLAPVRALTEMPLPFRLQGLTGGHGSPRLGTGGEFRDVNLFIPGDRLRRIDWRVTSRRAGQSSTPGHPTRIVDLFVRRTFAVADATIMLVIDSRDEVGSQVSSWGLLAPLRPDDVTSLDLTREAAASVARRYLELGDRVGLQDLGRARTRIAPAGGRRQLERLTEQLARSEPTGEPAPHVRPPVLPAGALVVIFSTFLDDEPTRLARLWRRSGLRVIAVDVLPNLDRTDLTDLAGIAFDLLRLERDDRLTELADTGIDVIRWRAPDEGAGDAAVPQTPWSRMARAERRR
jgi:uncharacterized protein (DUF58 family)